MANSNIIAGKLKLWGWAITSLALGAGIFLLGRVHYLWPAAVLVVLVVELWGLWNKRHVEALSGPLPRAIAGAAVVLLVAVAPRVATQIGLAAAFALWRFFSPRLRDAVNVLVVETTVYWSVFMISAVWRSPEWILLLLIWGGSYLPVYLALAVRKERAGAVLAATWALVATEIAWVFVRWLYVYTVHGGYLMVPQPTLVLGTLGYCFGSIYLSQRDGSLSRGRLTEYLLIGLILITIVITGTPWRGTL